MEKKLREQVVDQRREGKTIREIAKWLRTSSRTVGAILKSNELSEIKAELGAKEKEKKVVQPTNYTKALKLFLKGNSILDVTIKLGITSNEAKMAHIDFCDLQTCDQFGGVNNKFKEYLPALLSLYNTLMEKGLSSYDSLLAIEYVRNRAQAEANLQSLARSVIALQAEERKHISKSIPSMIQFALQLPAIGPDGLQVSDNLAYKLSISNVVDDLGLSKQIIA